MKLSIPYWQSFRASKFIGLNVVYLNCTKAYTITIRTQIPQGNFSDTYAGLHYFLLFLNELCVVWVYAKNISAQSLYI